LQKLQGELMELSGISSEFPSNSKSFKEFQLQEILYLPCEKPDIESILRTTADVKINKSHMILTPASTSYESLKLTGKKLIIEGELNHKIEYTANDISQSVHSSHFHVTFSTYIVLDESFNSEPNFVVTPYIEDIYIKQLGKRQIFQNALLLLDAKDLGCI
jgi:hypothetical protein